MTSYRTTMREALAIMNEDNLEKMRKAAGGAKQTLKMKDGSIGMDSFTASAIMQIYDKVNDKNRKTMENLLKDGKKADIVKLMKFAMSKVNAEYVPEEFELDEEKGPRQLVNPNKEIMVVKKNKVIVIDKKDKDKYMKKGWTLAEEVELDEAKYELYHKDFSSAMQHAYKMAKKLYGITIDPEEIDDKVATGPKKPSEGKTNRYRLKGDKGAIQVQVYNRGGDNKLKYPSRDFELNMYKEEVELDEGSVEFLDHDASDKDFVAMAKKYKLKIKSDGEDTVATGDPKNIEKLLQNMYGNDWKDMYSVKGGKYTEEEVELDEAKIAKKVPAKGGGHFIVLHRDTKGMSGKQDKFLMRTLNKGKVTDYGTHVSVDRALGFAKNKGIIEEIEEGYKPVKDDHYDVKVTVSDREVDKVKSYIMNSSEYNNGEIEDVDSDQVDGGGQAFKGKGDIFIQGDGAGSLGVDLQKEFGRKIKVMGEEVKIEEGAAADARRAMRADPDMKQKGFSKDVSATDDDRKAASKNIMMQMRKAQSLKGRFDVEFQDGKKTKVPTEVAMAVQKKYNSLRKPADKEKFQAKVGKSYKDMLAALKEGFASDAQRRAAFASGYKEKGKKKKESTLERMNRKIQEKKNG